jgi:hypothetical protein
MFLSSEYVTRTSGKARGDEEAGEEEEEEREKEKIPYCRQMLHAPALALLRAFIKFRDRLDLATLFKLHRGYI